MRDEKLAVIVVNFGSHELLEVNLVGVEKAAHVIVVDNYFSDFERTQIRQRSAQHGWDLIESRSNLGFGAACNIGARRASERGCDAVLFLNPDASITSDSIYELREFSRENPTAIVSPLILDAAKRTWFEGGVLDRVRGVARHATSAEVGLADWLTGACLWVPISALDALGGFSEKYFLYWEDVDLTWRHRESGGALLVHRGAKAQHDAGGTQGVGGKSAIYLQQQSRNRLRFAQENLGLKLAFLWAITTPAFVVHLARLSGLRHRRVRTTTFTRSVLCGSATGLLALGVEIFSIDKRRPGK